jgi:hypothetical protein
MRYTKTELEFMAQTVRHELSIFLGEWYLAQDKGLPYRPTTAQKSSHRTLLETAIRGKLITIKGVKNITRFTPLYDKQNRVLEVVFSLETNAGELDSFWKSPQGGP